MEGYDYEATVRKVMAKMECLDLAPWQAESVVEGLFSIPDFARKRVAKEVEKRMSARQS